MLDPEDASRLVPDRYHGVPTPHVRIPVLRETGIARKLIQAARSGPLYLSQQSVGHPLPVHLLLAAA